MSGERKETREKGRDVRSGNLIAARAVASAVRTSLGPKGMDKMIISPDGSVTITNDGATILQKMEVEHPAAKMLVDLSKAQDVEAGDGTTSVVILAGAFLTAAETLLGKGIHPTIIAESLKRTGTKIQSILKSIAIPLDLSDRESILKSARTSLSSKMVSQASTKLAPIAVDAVLRVIDPKTATNVDLRDIRVVKKLGGTIDDIELVDGLILNQHVSGSAGGITTIENGKIALIQFQLSPPKSNIDSSLGISDYNQMDRVLKSQRRYILRMCKAIKKTGCRVLLIQKSILRDAVNAQSLHFLQEMGIMVVRDIERSEIEFLCKTLGLTPIASVEGISPTKMGEAAMIEQISTGGGKIIKITGIKKPQRKTASVLVRGSNPLVLDESERSLHDALCVVRSLVKEKYLLPGGGAPEIELAVRLSEHAKTLSGKESYCVRAFSEALEIIPFTLAENAGLDPVKIVTKLRSEHKAGKVSAGINVRKGEVTDILEENVLQPLLVTSSAMSLAIETIIMILKIDDVVDTR